MNNYHPQLTLWKLAAPVQSPSLEGIWGRYETQGSATLRCGEKKGQGSMEEGGEGIDEDGRG